jgi:hypothetical protein
VSSHSAGLRTLTLKENKMARGIKVANQAPAAPLGSTVDGLVSTDQGQASGLGGTGGVSNTVNGKGVKTIDVQYKTLAGVAVAHGFVINQKGSAKFLVDDSAATGTHISVVQLVNKAPAALAAGEASIECYDTAGAPFYARRISTKHVYDFAGNKFMYKVNTPATSAYANVAAY